MASVTSHLVDANRYLRAITDATWDNTNELKFNSTMVMLQNEFLFNTKELEDQSRELKSLEDQKRLFRAIHATPRWVDASFAITTVAMTALSVIGSFSIPFGLSVAMAMALIAKEIFIRMTEDSFNSHMNKIEKCEEKISTAQEKLENVKKRQEFFTNPVYHEKMVEDVYSYVDFSPAMLFSIVLDGQDYSYIPRNRVLTSRAKKLQGCTE